MNKRKWSRGEKWLLVLSCGLCAPALALGWIYERQNELPPAPKRVEEVPPEPNAFDVITQAVAVAPALPSPIYLKNTCTPSKVDSDYGCGGSQRPAQPFTAQYNHEFPLKNKSVYLKANQNALKLWRDAQALPLYLPENLYASGRLNKSQIKLWENRALLTGAARIQARASWQRNDNSQALRWLLAIHRTYCRESASFYNGRNHSRDFYVLRGTVRRRGVALDDLEHLMPYLNAAQLREAARGIEENRKLLPTLVEAIKATEKRYMRLNHEWLARNDLSITADENHLKRGDVSATEQFLFRWMNKKVALKRLQKQFDWFIAQAQLPSTQRYRDGVAGMPDDVIVGVSSNDLLRYVGFMGGFNSEFSKIETIDSREIVLQTAMAARSFALEHGRNPRALRELVPRYLPKLEADPFNPTQPLRYSPQPKFYPEVRMGGPIYTLPLPKGAVEAIPLGPPGVPPRPGNIVGYHTFHIKRTLPFLLYSVGENSRDDGGMDFKAISSSSGPMTVCDDVLAPAEWFQVSSPTQGRPLWTTTSELPPV